MTQLWQRFPPRTSAPSWPATEQTREALLARLLAAPFTVEEDRAARARRQLGLVRLLDWLGEHPGDTWQQRWLASGADAMGNAEWWRPLLAWARPRNPRAGVSTSSNLRVCALLLAGADVIRPSLDWVLTPRAPQNLVAVMARARDPHGFAELSALCAASPAGTDDEDRGAAPRGDHPRGQGRNPARDHRRGLPGAVAGHRQQIAAREQGDGVLPAAARDGRVLPGRAHRRSGRSAPPASSARPS